MDAEPGGNSVVEFAAFAFAHRRRGTARWTSEGTESIMRTNWRRTNGVRRRWPALLVVVIVMTSILAACGGGSTPATTAPSAQPTAATVPSSAPSTAPTPTRAAAAPTTAAPRTTSTATSRPLTQQITTTFPARVAGLDYGMNVWLPTADMDRTLGLMTDAGFGWARQWISWESVEPTQGSYSWDTLDKVVAAAERKNVKLMLILLRAPAWAAPNGGIPKDKQLYARFVSTVATRYKNRVSAYEIWNEANLAGETGGMVNVAEYAELLHPYDEAFEAAIRQSGLGYWSYITYHTEAAQKELERDEKRENDAEKPGRKKVAVSL